MHGFILHRFFCARIFLHGFIAWTFFAQIVARFFCCTDFCADFCTSFLHGFFAQILFVRNHLLGSAELSLRKSPSEFSMLWGPCGEGLGKQEGEVENLANLTKATALRTWGGWGGAPLEEVAVLVDLNQDSKGKIKIMPSAERGRPERTINRDLELCSKLFTRLISSPLHPGLRKNSTNREGPKIFCLRVGTLH